jgi:hypothetical protein
MCFNERNELQIQTWSEQLMIVCDKQHEYIVFNTEIDAMLWKLELKLFIFCCRWALTQILLKSFPPEKKLYKTYYRWLLVSI